MENAELIKLLNKEMAIEIAPQRSYEEIHTLLASYINTLVKNDFEKLVAYLYRIDVHEEKLKALLRNNPDEDAGDIIAALIIERQLQKIKLREQFSKPISGSGEEETW